MKIIAVCKTFRGREFAISSLDSCYPYVSQMIYCHGVTDWIGRPGNNVRPVVENAADPEKKIIHLEAAAGATQAQQYDIIVDYILGRGLEFDYLFLSDTDEIMGDDDWKKTTGLLEANLLSKMPVLAYKCKLHSYIKSPFFQINPPVTLKPVLFLHRSAVRPGVIGIRGSTFSAGARLLDVYVHHFCAVRESLEEVWAKHETSCYAENEPLCDKQEWISSVWNKLPNAINLLPLKNYQMLWLGVKTITMDDLPPVVRKNLLVLAWQKYMSIIPKRNDRVITPELLMKNLLPPDFGPNHKLFKFASFKTRYLRLLNPIEIMSAPPPIEEPIEIHTEVPFSTITGLRASNEVTSKPGRSLAIMTIVSGPYQWYIPMFLYCLRRAIPEATPLIYTRGPCLFPAPWANLCIALPDEYVGEGYTTAALRYCYSDARIEEFDYCLITDIDIMMQPESVSLIDQHTRSMKKQKLECYDNYVSTNSETTKRVPGVHFVTKDWWARTADARSRYMIELKTTGATSYDFDELMLYRIISESKLPEPPKLPNLWAHHGIHLGDWRRHVDKKNPPRKTIPGDHNSFLIELMADRGFLAIMNQCSMQLPLIGKLFKWFKIIISG